MSTHVYIHQYSTHTPFLPRTFSLNLIYNYYVHIMRLQQCTGEYIRPALSNRIDALRCAINILQDTENKCTL